ncbi:MAG: Hsp70 family protein [Planctomycetes bacterium]|nr:Hsp70 family protein [Planctomycetota bacterium]MBI3836204.1 Hsp70 family protein [Planctomycetota bacterium]
MSRRSFVTTTNDPIIGIDLGTTNSLVAYADEAGPHLIPNPDDSNDFLLPSVVAFHEAGNVLAIGREARSHAVERPLTTIHSVKRLIGRGAADLTQEARRLTYPLKSHSSEAGRDIIAVKIGDRRFTPQEISAMILVELRRWAELHFQRDVTRAVITVPAQFDDAQRQATRDAGAIAGLDVIRIINEPTAAALAYGLNRAEQATIAVYDFGGGTFDISILRLEDGVFEVLATNGDTHLGGDDLDHGLIGLFTREIADSLGVQIASPAIRQQLRTLAENVKMQLSDEDVANVEIALPPSLTRRGTGEVYPPVSPLGKGGGSEAVTCHEIYRRKITRGEFEDMARPWVDRTIEACGRAMKTAQLNPADIDQVVLVGGSTRIPYVRQRVSEVFQRRPYTALVPEHVVALGAGVQASILAGVKRDVLLLDVTPLSLGIETMGGAVGKLILANTKVPCRASEMFTTFKDGQTSIKINVLQGERELAADCRSLGVFELRGIPPMPAGIPKLEVTFLIDQNGILNVSAKELRSGMEASVQIVPTHGLTREEVCKMQAEALAHAREDMSAHHLIDVRTTLEFDLNKAERMIHQFGRLLEPRELRRLLQQVNELRDLAKISNNAEELNRRREEFDRAVLPLAEMAMSETLKEEATKM